MLLQFLCVFSWLNSSFPFITEYCCIAWDTLLSINSGSEGPGILVKAPHATVTCRLGWASFYPVVGEPRPRSGSRLQILQSWWKSGPCRSHPTLPHITLGAWPGLCSNLTPDAKVKSFSRVRLFVTPWTVACTRLLCPWDFPGKNTGVGCDCLLQGIFPTQKSNADLLPCRQTLYPLSHQRTHPKCDLSLCTRHSPL